MSKYPGVLFLRFDKYSHVDESVKNLNCQVHITNDPSHIEKLYTTDIHILVTYGPDEVEYRSLVNKYICTRLYKRWIHYKNIIPAEFERGVNYCYIDNVISDRKTTRPIFSAFTTTFNSFDKILRPYHSLKSQTEKDWEWVIVDDSTDEANWTFMKEKFANEPKIRLYKRASNSGNIGNVKNEAIGLCRGNYILELDHDDEIIPSLIKDTISGFTKFPETDFIYMDFINIYENGRNFSYKGILSRGYAGYYYEYYKARNQWVKVFITPQINSVTACSLPCMPNHPRIWRREKLLEIGSFSEYLPICDDQEVLLRTILNLKILKIPKFAYIQYFNDGGSNFSLIRNKEINRIGPHYITPQFNAKHKLELAKPSGSQEPMPIWLRESFEGNFINTLYHPDYDLQFAIIGIEAFYKNLPMLINYCSDPKNDFILLDNKGEDQEIIDVLNKNMTRCKFHIMKGATKDELINYFNLICKFTDSRIVD